MISRNSALNTIERGAWDHGNDQHALRQRFGHISRADQRILPMIFTSSPLPS